MQIACVLVVVAVGLGVPPADAALAPPPVRLPRLFDRPAWTGLPPGLPFPIAPAVGMWEEVPSAVDRPSIGELPWMIVRNSNTSLGLN
jgi:hypothetical protein